MSEQEAIKLTAFASGAGCGCKIAPAVLEEILQSKTATTTFPALLVGNSSKDDAAVYDLGNGDCLISTTDFFMPIVDDAFDFGRIAAANAISDVYAMGGKPLMAISPQSGLVNPSKQRKVVVLPAPFGPSSPKHSPRVRLKLTPATTSRCA